MLNSSDPSKVLTENVSELAEFSVDDIFSKYSVAQVQKFQFEYKRNVSQAKDDLHRLVGEKYRDLVRIAEDIEGMNSVSRTVDMQLAGLSYKSSSYIQFGANPLSKFDTVMREKKAKLARSKSSETILNNVINNKLIGLDLKLRTKTLRKSSTLIFLAKLYYTISITFKETLLKSSHVNMNLSILKRNFIHHLEHKIATANTGCESLLAPSELFVHRENMKSEEADDFDIFDDAFVEDEQDDISDTEENDCSIPSLAKFSSPSSIVNYIIAYIIVNRDDEKFCTLEDIADKIISLRVSYLKSCLSQALANVKVSSKHQIEFFPIFSYIEFTCAFTQKHFFSPEATSSDLLKALRSLSDWNASDLIGFHNWFDEELVRFNGFQDSFPISSQSFIKKLSAFSSITYNYVVDCAIKLNKLLDCYENAQGALKMFHRFIIGFMRLEVLCSINATKCFTLQIFAQNDVVSKLLHYVQKQVIAKEIKKHFGRLNAEEPNSISQLINEEIETRSFKGEALDEPFTSNLFNLMDDNMNDYIQAIVGLSLSQKGNFVKSSLPNSEIALKNWFAKSLSLIKLLSPAEEGTLKSLYLALEHEFKEASVITESWGTFTKSHLENVFVELKQSVLKSYLEQVNQFSSSIDKLVDVHLHLNEINCKYFFLRLLLIMRENLRLVDVELEGPSIDKNVDHICQDIFRQLSSVHIGEETFEEFMLNGSILKLQADSITLPVRPHLALSSAIIELVDNLLNSTNYSRFEMCTLFLNRILRERFVLAKREWIMECLVDKMLENIDRELILVNKSSQDNEEITQRGADLMGRQQTQIQLEKDENLEDADNWNEDDLEWDDETALVAAENEEEASSETKPAEVSTGEPTKDSSEAQDATDQFAAQKARQYLANIVFLLNFVMDEGVSVEHECIVAAINKLKPMIKTESAVENSAVEYIVRNVNEFYKSSRQTFLPLLAC